MKTFVSHTDIEVPRYFILSSTRLRVHAERSSKQQAKTNDEQNKLCFSFSSCRDINIVIRRRRIPIKCKHIYCSRSILSLLYYTSLRNNDIYWRRNNGTLAALERNKRTLVFRWLMIGQVEIAKFRKHPLNWFWRKQSRYTMTFFYYLRTISILDVASSYRSAANFDVFVLLAKYFFFFYFFHKNNYKKKPNILRAVGILRS